LQRITQWSSNPADYYKVFLSNFRHLSDLRFTRFMCMPFAMDVSLYRYLALSHALYAQLRFIPLVPLDMPLTHRYVMFLQTLETLHGREIQTQIAMLKNIPVDLSPKERETVVGEESKRVQDVFNRFISELAGIE
jgi:hypothetical protein